MTFSDAALTRLSAVRASADTASAAPLSLVEDISSCCAVPRRLPSACWIEPRNAAMALATLSLRCSFSCARLGLRPRSGGRARSCCRGTRSRCAPSRRSRRRRAVAGMRPRYRRRRAVSWLAARPLSGRVMLRPISQLKPRPISTAAMPTPAMMDARACCDAASAAAAARL